MSDAEQLAFATTWESAGGRVAALIDGVSAIAVLGDDPVATASVALGVARAQALHRRVFVADLLAADNPLSRGARDAEFGLSDMLLFGVSLGKAAVQSEDSPNLFYIASAADGSVFEDVVASARWQTLSDMVHRAGALLVVAVGGHVERSERVLEQLDGTLLVDNARLPVSGLRVLGEVRNAATMRSPAMAALPIPEAVPVAQNRRWPWVLVGLAAVLGAALGIPASRQWLFDRLGSEPEATAPPSVASVPAAPIAPSRPTSDAAWSVEFLYTNSEQDAIARVRTAADSLPAATFAAPVVGADSTLWFSLVSGAFSDSLSAESFLRELRTRAVLAGSAGVVRHTPFAFLLDSSLDNTIASLRVSAYRGRSIPAYTLRDSLGMWHVYAGAFPTSNDASLLRRKLDSLNIQSTLTLRVGGTP